MLNLILVIPAMKFSPKEIPSKLRPDTYMRVSSEKEEKKWNRKSIAGIGRTCTKFEVQKKNTGT